MKRKSIILLYVSILLIQVFNHSGCEENIIGIKHLDISFDHDSDPHHDLNHRRSYNANHNSNDIQRACTHVRRANVLSKGNNRWNHHNSFINYGLHQKSASGKRGGEAFYQRNNANFRLLMENKRENDFRRGFGGKNQGDIKSGVVYNDEIGVDSINSKIYGDFAPIMTEIKNFGVTAHQNLKIGDLKAFDGLYGILLIEDRFL